jgi:hypothetical protein
MLMWTKVLEGRQPGKGAGGASSRVLDVDYDRRPTTVVRVAGAERRQWAQVAQSGRRLHRPRDRSGRFFNARALSPWLQPSGCPCRKLNLAAVPSAGQDTQIAAGEFAEPLHKARGRGGDAYRSLMRIALSQFVLTRLRKNVSHGVVRATLRGARISNLLV